MGEVDDVVVSKGIEPLAKHFHFNIKRSEYEIILPCDPTPNDCLYLSNLDDQEMCCERTATLMIYKPNPVMEGKDPRKLIKEALAKVLVPYYPYAGKLRKDQVRNKIYVDCMDLGVPFIEAEADITLEEMGELQQPPFPCVEELAYDIPGMQDITDTPILVVQVTVFKCGGFIFAPRVNEAVCDARGNMQFMKAWGEICKGQTELAVQPVWDRELLLSPRNPPQVNIPMHQYDADPPLLPGTHVLSMSGMALHCCELGKTHIETLKRHAEKDKDGEMFTGFEVILAFMWRSRVRAMEMAEKQELRLIFMVDARNRMNPPLPKGFYGNVLGMPCIVSTAGEICSASLGDIAAMIRAAKEMVDDEYMRSQIDYLELNRTAKYPDVGTFSATDLRRIEFLEVDFGWGTPVYSNGAVDHDTVAEAEHCYIMPLRRCPNEALAVHFLPQRSLAKFKEEYVSFFGAFPTRKTEKAARKYKRLLNS